MAKKQTAKPKSQLENVAEKTEDIGNHHYASWKRSRNKDLQSAKVAIAAFKTTLQANSLMLQERKMNREEEKVK